MNKNIILLWAAFQAVFSFSSAQQQKNVTLIGNLDYTEELSDIWGYTDGNGNEYALVGVYNGVSIVDLSDPTQPTELHFLPGEETIWRDLKTFGTHAYVSNEGADGLRIIDLSGLPATVNYKDTVYGDVETIHNVYMDNGNIYAVGLSSQQFGGGMLILDLNTDPWNPSLVGSYTNAYVHDVYVRNHIAYLAEILTGNLRIIDVTDPANLVDLGARSYVNSFTHNTWLSTNSNVCFTTDELEAAYLYAWEVSDPGDIVELDAIRSSLSRGLAIPHNTHVLNDYLVTSYYRDGVHIVDANRPTNLIEVGYYDTSDSLEESGFNGAWGAYPFLPSGNLLVTDIEKGLFVLQASYQRACYLEGDITEAGSNKPLSNVEIRFLEAPVKDQSRTTGAYATGIADAGTYEVQFAKLGYETQVRTVTLSNGQVVIEDVDLVPLTAIPYELLTFHRDSMVAVGGVQVRLIAPSEEWIVDFVSDANGLIQINNLLPTTYEVQVGRWGYRMQSYQLTLTANSTLDTLKMREGHEDDFNFELGWSSFGGASRGYWERGEPMGTTGEGRQYINPELDLAGDIGQQAYVTGNAGGNSGTDDVDGGQVILRSPVIDLSIYNEPLLRFHWWFVNYSSQERDIGDDFFRVEMSDGVQTVTILEDSTFDGFGNQWTKLDSFRILDHFSGTNPVFLQFITEDEGMPNLVEAAIDAFAVYDANPTWPTAVEAPLFEGSFALFPNPVLDRVQFEWDLAAVDYEQVSIEIWTLQGQRILSLPVQTMGGAQQIAFPYASGLYLAQLTAKGRTLAVRKFVK